MAAIKLTPEQIAQGQFVDVAPGVQYQPPTAPGAIRLSPDQIQQGRYLDDVGGFESFLRGGAQGLTFGFADEISGAFESIFSGKTYEQARDESRRNFEAAQLANPGLFTGGEIAGAVGTAFIPGIGAARGASTAAKLGRAALEGGIAGSGFSEATDLGGVIEDSVKGAALSAGVGGAGMAVARGASAAGQAAKRGIADAARRLAQSAPDRAKKRIIKQITSGANKKWINPIIDDKKATERISQMILDDDALFAAHRSPEALIEAIDDKLVPINKALDKIYAATDKVSRGIEVYDVVKVAYDMAAKLRRQGQTRAAKVLSRVARDVRREFGDESRRFVGGMRGAPGVATNAMAASELRVWRRAVRKDARVGTMSPPKEALDDLATAWQKMLNEHVEKVAERSGAKASAETMRKFNRDIADLVMVKDAAESAAARGRGTTEVAPLSIKNIKLAATNPSFATFGAVVDPMGIGGANAAWQVGKRAATAVDDALARGAGLPEVSRAADAAVAVGRGAGAAGRRLAAAASGDLAGRKKGTPQAQTELAKMARAGAPVREILAKAEELGVPEDRAISIARLFGT